MAEDFVAGWQRRYAEALRLLGADAAAADPLARADALWLARVLPTSSEGAGTGMRAQHPTPRRVHQPARKGRNLPDPADHTPAVVPPSHTGSAPTASLFAPQTGTGSEAQLKARRVSVPVADALPGRRAIERALKPFLRRRPSARYRVVDAEATAEASANASAELLAVGAATHAIVPVLRPLPERWFDVALVVEDDEAMLAFEDTVRELRDLMAHHGAFGQVRLWRFAAQSKAVVVHSPAGLPCAPLALLQSHRPQLVLLLTHGASPHWELPVLRRFVRDLAQRSLVSIVQMLPGKLWSFTALGEATERVRSPWRGAPNRQLQRLDLFSGLYLRNTGAAAVPVLALEPRGTADWARWVMAARQLDQAAVAFDTDGATPEPAAKPASPADAAAVVRERVLGFRNVASGQGFALLRLLAASWITLPVMRLLANALPGPRSAAPLAEVLLSGLLVRQSPPGVPAHELVFEFVPGVREWLHGSLSSDEQRQADAAMAASRESIRRFVEEKTGARLASFEALLLDPLGADLLPATARSFVEVSRGLRSLRDLPVVSTPPAHAVTQAVAGTLHGFPLPARDLIPRTQLEQRILQRVLGVRIGGREELAVLSSSGALMLLARVLAHPDVRHRYGGGIWFGADPPRVGGGSPVPRLFLSTRRGGGRKQAGDTLIDLRWFTEREAPDIGFLSHAETVAWLATLGLSTAQAKRLDPLHGGMPLLLQVVGVGTTLGVTRWPKLGEDASRDERFTAYVRALMNRIKPAAQAEGLLLMAARRPGYPAGIPPPGAELAPRLGWLCPGAAGAADTLHPNVARRLESALPAEAARAHSSVLRELRANLNATSFANYAREHLLAHARAAGGVAEVRRVLFDRHWLAVLLASGAGALLNQLGPLAKSDKQLGDFLLRLEQAARAQPGAMAGRLAQHPSLLDGARAAFAPEAGWRTRMAIDVAHRANLTGSGVRIALVSTGVDLKHPELQHLVFSGVDTDPNGHGTMVASVMAGRFVGIAPSASLWSLRAMDAQGKGTDQSLLHAFQAIATAPAAERPDIVCLPMGMEGSGPSPLRGALEALAGLGPLLVAAAGNDAKSKLSFPASMPQVLSVGALAADQPAQFSNTSADGRRPELWAPGTDIVVALPMQELPDAEGKRVPDKGEVPAPYGRVAGTSLACAAVAGLAALIAEATGLRGSALREALLRNADGSHARFVLRGGGLSGADLEGLQQDARAALGQIGVFLVDILALNIVVEAAILAPEPGFDPEISLSRLFCAAYHVGQALLKNDNEDSTHVATLARTLNGREWATVLSENLNRFHRDNFAGAKQRLTKGFSANARSALREAQLRSSEGLTGDGLVLALIGPNTDYRGGLLYKWVSIEELQSAFIEVLEVHGVQGDTPEILVTLLETTGGREDVVMRALAWLDAAGHGIGTPDTLKTLLTTTRGRADVVRRALAWLQRAGDHESSHEVVSTLLETTGGEETLEGFSDGPIVTESWYRRFLDYTIAEPFQLRFDEESGRVRSVTLSHVFMEGNDQSTCDFLVILPPETDALKGQLDFVEAYADLRADRSTEIIDQDVEILSHFFGLVAPLNPERTTFTLEILRVALRFCATVEKRIKHAFALPRPSALSARVQPIINAPAQGALPGGHATEAFLIANVLGRLIDSAGGIGYSSSNPHAIWNEQMLRLASRIATNRTVAGVNYPVDSAAGAVLGTKLAEYILQRFKPRLSESAAPCTPDVFYGRNCQGADFHYASYRDMMAGNPVPGSSSPAFESNIGTIHGTRPSKQLNWMWNKATAELAPFYLQ